jgi:hypothetical protein
MEDLSSRIAQCEARFRQLRLLFLTVVPLLAIGLFGLAWREQHRASLPDSVRLKELAIVDIQGIVRARLGGQLPDPVMNGKSVPRGQQIAGMLLYDDTGQERGGYVTFSPSGNVALTLDTRQRQVALFVAGPNDGAAAKLWRGSDFIEMRSDPTGSRINAGRSDQLVLQSHPCRMQTRKVFACPLRTN